MMRKPNILITGGSGLIGSRLIEKLAGKVNLCVLDMEAPSFNNSFFIKTDLTKDESVRSAVQQAKDFMGPKLASVLHLAAYYDFSGKPSSLYQELTVQGTKRLLDSLQEQGMEVEQFVFSSSLLVMKPTEPGEPITESSPKEGEWAYPQSKLEAEAVIRRHPSNFTKVILRIAGVYDEWCHSIPIAHQIQRIYEKELESHLFPGDTSHGQPFVHTDDLVQCFWKLVQKRHTLGPEEMFLVAEPEVVSYEELQRRIGEQLHGTSWTTLRIPKAVAKIGATVKNALGEKQFIQPWMVNLADDHYAANVSRAQHLLDWAPKHQLRYELDKILSHLLQNPKKWYEENNLGDAPELEKATPRDRSQHSATLY